MSHQALVAVVDTERRSRKGHGDAESTSDIFKVTKVYFPGVWCYFEPYAEDVFDSMVSRYA